MTDLRRFVGNCNEYSLFILYRHMDQLKGLWSQI